MRTCAFPLSVERGRFTHDGSDMRSVKFDLINRRGANTSTPTELDMIFTGLAENRGCERAVYRQRCAKLSDQVKSARNTV
jgi:hypothetical protein